ncbi:MAG: hypothetical protein U1C72_02685, partial [Candidatus Pacearchaeota archaeon]|nr:hypothetical protein [Candidatus Pacearchaeota archaeon]
VEIGDEAIGNRFLFLQEFFAQKGLRVREVAPGNISYPWVQLHEEDAVLASRLGRFVSREAIEKAPKLASSLWVFDRIPFKVKHVAMKGSIYSYI